MRYQVKHIGTYENRQQAAANAKKIAFSYAKRITNLEVELVSTNDTDIKEKIDYCILIKCNYLNNNNELLSYSKGFCFKFSELKNTDQ